MLKGTHTTLCSVTVPPAVVLGVGQIVSPEVTARGSLTLRVSISGFNLPLTSVSWTQHGRTLAGSEDGVTITNTPMLPAMSAPVTSMLLISATVPRDSGAYSVTASNDAGSETLEFTVSVTGEARPSGSEGISVPSWKNSLWRLAYFQPRR